MTDEEIFAQQKRAGESREFHRERRARAVEFFESSSGFRNIDVAAEFDVCETHARLMLRRGRLEREWERRQA